VNHIQTYYLRCAYESFGINLINFANSNSHNWPFKNSKFLALKNIAKQDWQIFSKRVIFGNICQIWHHLATLL